MRHAIRRSLQSALLCTASFAAVTLAAPGSAEAFCGFYVAGADTELYNNATMVVLMRDGTRTVLSMQNNYQGPPTDFAEACAAEVEAEAGTEAGTEAAVRTVRPKKRARARARAPSLSPSWPSLAGFAVAVAVSSE